MRDMAGAIGVLHFTAPPHIGGVESIVAAQVEVLRAAGAEVHLIVADGDRMDGALLSSIPEIHPAHPTILEARAALGGSLPSREHALVRSLCSRLEELLEGCSQCWVHNALTVYLNPFLSVALASLIDRHRDIRWIAWCHDLSERSDFVLPLSPQERAVVTVTSPAVRYVTDSAARRTELAALRSLEEDEITVIRPPLDALAWMGIGEEARRIADTLSLQYRFPVVLVPSKLLPHKNLSFAVRVAGALTSHAPSALVLITAASSPHEAAVSAQLRSDLLDLAGSLGAPDAVALATDILDSAPRWSTVRDLMCLSDLVFLPSREEGYGMPVLEAAALRCPVLCSDIPAFRESGRGWAEHAPVNASVEEVVARIVAMASSPANCARREALAARHHFAEAVLGLAGLP
jgi:glycosyltransferase involved in cell wall biosynthesis